MKRIILLSAVSLLFGCSNGQYNNPEASLAKEEALVGTLSGNSDAGSYTAAEEQNDEGTYVVKMADNAMGSTAPEAVKTPNDTPRPIKSPDKIIKTASIRMMVEDYKKSRTEIEKIVKSSRAYIASEKEEGNSYSSSNELVIRVLNSDFDALVNKLTGIAKEVNTKEIRSDDVTAQFVDIQARLKTKKEVELRYLSILQKAGKITDILEVEEKLRAIREEIEAKEGELKYLTDRVAYSTIHLNFYQTFEYLPSDRPGFFPQLANSIKTGWHGLLSFVVGFLALWPLWLVLGGIGYLVYRTIRKELKREKLK